VFGGCGGLSQWRKGRGVLEGGGFGEKERSSEGRGKREHRDRCGIQERGGSRRQWIKMRRNERIWVEGGVPGWRVRVKWRWVR